MAREPKGRTQHEKIAEMFYDTIVEFIVRYGGYNKVSGDYSCRLKHYTLYYNKNDKKVYMQVNFKSTFLDMDSSFFQSFIFSRDTICE